MRIYYVFNGSKEGIGFLRKHRVGVLFSYFGITDKASGYGVEDRFAELVALRRKATKRKNRVTR